MPGKALITGGAGFIGSHLAELLLEQGWEVYALDDVSTGSMENLAGLTERDDFHLVVESVLSPAVVSELVHKCDVVYHLAAVVGVQLIVEQPGHTLLTNIQGTENVLEYCTKFGKRVLVASSSEVYGDHPEEQLLAEDARRIYGPTTARRWAYADSKAIDEFLALAWHEERGLDCIIARLFNTVGPRQSGQYGMVIPRFVSSALGERPLEVHGDGMQTRCFCHVSDTVRGLMGLMDSGVSGALFNIARRSGSPSASSPSASAPKPAARRRSRSCRTRTCSHTDRWRRCSIASRRSRRSARRSDGRRRRRSTRSSTT